MFKALKMYISHTLAIFFLNVLSKNMFFFVFVSCFFFIFFLHRVLCIQTVQKQIGILAPNQFFFINICSTKHILHMRWEH